MNERMIELHKQAVEFAYKTCKEEGRAKWETDYIRNTLTTSKFAELIVLEMCNVLDRAQWDKGQDWVCADGTRIIPQIKQHFGVEE